MQIVEAGPWQTVLDNMGLVYVWASRAYRKWYKLIPKDDLIAYGRLGLFDAAVRYDPSKGVTFPAFAYKKVWYAMYDGMFLFAGAQRVRTETGLVARRSLVTLSLDEMREAYGFDYGDDMPEYDYIVNRDAARSELKLIWAFLDDRQRQILYSYLVEEKSVAQIGRDFGVTESRISQHRTAIRKIASFVHEELLNLPAVTPGGHGVKKDK